MPEPRAEPARAWMKSLGFRLFLEEGWDLCVPMLDPGEPLGQKGQAELHIHTF